MTTEKKRKFLIDILFLAAVLAVAYFAVEYLLVWLLPFVIGLIAAICLQKPVDFLTRKTKLRRGFWSCLLVLTVLCAIFALVVLLFNVVVNETPGFVSWLTSLIPGVQDTFSDISDWFSRLNERLPFDLNNSLASAPSKIIESAITALTGFLGTAVPTVITVAPGLLIASVFSVVASCYITMDYRKICNFILCQLSEKNKVLVVNVKKLFVTNILKMLRGYIIILSITFCELLIGLLILRVDYAPALAALIAILDILPVVGTGTVLIPWSVISFCMGDFFMGFGILILYIAITVIRNIIEPRIIGDQVGLPPIVTLVAMYVGLKIFGVIGMLILPVAIIITVKLQEGGIIHLWKIPERTEENEAPGIKDKVKTAFVPKKKKSKK